MTDAEQFRAFRFALDPTTAQRQALARHVGAARWAFNHALACKVAAHHEWQAQVAVLIDAGVPEEDARRQIKVRIPTKPTIQLALNRAKGDDRTGHDGLCPWWHEVSTYAFQSALADADTAWGNWLASLSGRRTGRKIGYPRFKKKGRSRESVRLHNDVRRPTIRLDGYRRLMVPRIGSVRLHDSGKRLTRYLTRTGGQIQSVTLSRSGNHWYAAVLVKSPAAEPSTPSKSQRIAGTVGVDIGVTRLATLSTGIDTSYPNPRHLSVARRKLARAQRALSRTQKGSNRRAKARTRVAELHHRVAERRAGALHQITKQLATRFETIAVEDLNVAGMARSARGTLDEPGRNVRQKSGLNRAIMDAGFGEFRRQLAYKTTWYGSRLAVVDRFYPSSKTCSTCGAVKPKLRLSERTYRCDQCGLVIDRDQNAAINIATAAIAAPDAVPAVPVADDRPETLNARRAHVRPTLTGGQRALKWEDPGVPIPPGPPRRSNPAALPQPA
jgi:putative transposase